jgi:hypothetical protein
MKESYWGYWLVIFGIFIVVLLMLTNDATTTNTEDYYQLKEVANSAIYDSIDYTYYTKTQQIRMLKEVFVENFLRRFAETVSASDTYTVEFYDLYEAPPKVSVKISTSTAKFLVGDERAKRAKGESPQTSLDVVNSIDLIVEFNPNSPKDNPRGETGYGVAYDNFCDYYGS